ncbi:FAD-dependent oxidoreductase [Candidatus Microgenomates bacterium]|nr:MAG: FAD-dependent oxidoreductase [Candidatus Microgenomates bacterium]
MKIAIIGAGFVGLTAAYKLKNSGYDVTVFEKEKIPGGLAVGFCKPNWEWSLENHYHHIFTSDTYIQNLAKEVGVRTLFKRPKSKSLVGEKIYPLDSPGDVLLFPKLALLERIRMGLVLAFLKFNPIWKPMEKISATDWLKKYMGERAYSLLWEPLLQAKFGKFKKEIPLSWFWARIKKRSSFLGYPVGGFQNLAEKIVEKTEEKGGKFYFNSPVKEITREKNKIKVSFLNGEDFFDKVIVTTPSSLFVKIVKKLPESYIKSLEKLKMLSALNLVLILKKPFFNDNTYWLNICNKEFPFLSIVEHTNFINPSHYINQHLIYIGNYLPIDHPYFKLSPEQLLKIYTPYLKKINPNFELCILNFELFSAPFAQPIISLNYSKIVPPFETPLENIYLANMQQVYPWDRGTNYAVEMGERIAKIVIKC